MWRRDHLDCIFKVVRQASASLADRQARQSRSNDAERSDQTYLTQESHVSILLATTSQQVACQLLLFHYVQAMLTVQLITKLES